MLASYSQYIMILLGGMLYVVSNEESYDQITELFTKLIWKRFYTVRGKENFQKRYINSMNYPHLC